MPYIIDIKKLSKSFKNKKVVCDIDLQIKKGEVFGFLGPNGSGKTTTIRMICGLLNPDSGEGTCLGYDIIKEAAKIKKEIGYMTQRFSFYEDLTIRENLNFVAQVYRLPNIKESVDEAIYRLGITKDLEKQLAGKLSGGWKQRLALAASILHKPKLLLLDEPTAGVDPEARRDFWDKINRFAEEGITTLVSTHYMDEAERCHRLAYIAAGYILTKGTPNEIIQQSELYMMSVSGENIMRLASELYKITEEVQIVPFGQTIHIVGRDENLLEMILKPYHKKYRIQKMPVTLEDVFIYLVSESRDRIDEMCACYYKGECLERGAICRKKVGAEQHD